MTAPADERTISTPSGPPDASPGFFARWCRPLVLLFLFAISAGTVWAGNAVGWPAGLACAAVGGFTGLMAGGLVGVSVFQSFAVMTVFVCTLESATWGGLHHGWPGALLAGLAGILLGHLLGSLPLVLALCFADFPQPEAAGNPPSRAD